MGSGNSGKKVKNSFSISMKAPILEWESVHQKGQDFFLSHNVDQKRKILLTRQSSFSGKEIQESYTVQQKLNQETF